MAKKKKLTHRPTEQEGWSCKIKEKRENEPGDVDWELCAQAVDDLYLWIHELCEENFKLKQLINRTISKIKEDNENTKNILKSLGPEFKKIIPNKED